MSVNDEVGLGAHQRTMALLAWQEYLSEVLQMPVSEDHAAVLSDFIQQMDPSKTLPPGMAWGPANESVVGAPEITASNIQFYVEIKPPNVAQCEAASRGEVVCPRGDPFGPNHSMWILSPTLHNYRVDHISDGGRGQTYVVPERQIDTIAEYPIHMECSHGFRWMMPLGVVADFQ